MSNTSDAPPCGRRLWKWSFKKFINMIQRAAWTALATRRTVPANRPPDDRFTRYSPTGLAFARSGDAVTSAAAPPTATVLRRFVYESLVRATSTTAPP
ncbi:hypothetical protein Z052_16920 [Halorubrum sp. C191]|uniref:Uncharacterized protein n=1 Tax=Halorubrum ezzemoulense TaxID=337243 RepID=A0A256JXE2_HALEZ|nr:hypothetical protein DJ78_00100 [Halorubrum ezzemoulense]OYR82062.1 hypothetical protein DJ84_11480 [Halorubrum ezzemoulense]PHQ41049.1 hypothetical protein Z052_16920 [Halorubrum sp. C191]